MGLLSLQEQIRSIAEKIPDKVAIEHGSSSVTYSQIEENTNKFANFLYDKVGTGKAVFMLMEKGIDIVQAIIGVLKSDNIFIPIDPDFPDKRLEIMFRQVESCWVISQLKWLDKLNRIMEQSGRNINVAVADENLQNVDAYKNLNVFFIGNHTAGNTRVSYDINNKNCYIYFTSGSTGKPKGILGRHRSLAQFVQWEISEFGVDENFRISQFTSPSFDPFLRDVFVPLCSGGTLCIPENNGILLNPIKMVRWVDENRISLIHTVPSLFRSLTSALKDSNCFGNLKYILLAGEMLRGNDVKKFIELFKARIQLVNLYGPTETTLAKLYYRVQEGDVYRSCIPVGKPIDRAEAIILDENLKKSSIGDAGQIYIRTPYISSGYYNNADLTKQVFIKNPFSDNSQDIIYKTGDIGRMLPDGNIEVLGRIDNQVKIRGSRVEVEEIENKLLEHEAVREAVVKAIEDAESNKSLCAYITANEDLTTADLRRFVAADLPDYMVPSYFAILKEIPLTPNGKVDRNALPKPDERMRTQAEYIAASNEIEEKLVKIWSYILNMRDIGVNTSFFELGGHSLNMITLISKVYEEFGIELPLQEIIKYPTVRSISNYISGVALISRYNTYCEEQPMLLLNEKKEKNVFLFPPIAAHGIAFRHLANLIDYCTVYAFNFIEKHNPIPDYVRLITDVQKEGPYVFIGYSAGGNLAFEVAKELISQGYEVSDLILIDSYKKDMKGTLTTDNIKEFANNIAKGIDADSDFKEYFNNSFIVDKIYKKAKSYKEYTNDLIISGQINTNIYMIKADDSHSDLDLDDARKRWPVSTTKKFVEYNGFGRHSEMLNSEFAKKNEKIIRSIIKEIFIYMVNIV